MSVQEFAMKVRIGDKIVGDCEPTYIIAEAGVNHNGDMALAYQLIDVAAEAKADAVKFQLFDTDALIRADVRKAAYQLRDDSDQQSQYQMLKALEISVEQCASLQRYSQQRGLEFLVTPFDEPSLQRLATLNLAAMKISSTDLTNLPFLLQAAALRLPLILSTGMSEWSEVQKATDLLRSVCPELILLQCTSSYPAPTAQLNLRVIQSYRQQLRVLSGYSDHTPGLGAAAFAVAAGAVLVEKHFTLDKNLPGPDHQASLDPDELKAFVSQIRQVDLMMGTAVKGVELCEVPNRQSLQKALVARRAIAKGESFSLDNMKALRTGGHGISPLYTQQLIGKAAPAAFAAGDILYV